MKCAYVFKNPTSPWLAKPKQTVLKRKCAYKKSKDVKVVEYQYQYSRYKNEIQADSNHLSLKYVLQKVIYKSYTSYSSSCFSQNSTCQGVRPPCASFIPPSPEQRPGQLPQLRKSCPLTALAPALIDDGVSPYLLTLICPKF